MIEAIAQWLRRWADRLDPPPDAPRMGKVVVSTSDGHVAAFDGNATVTISNEMPRLPPLWKYPDILESRVGIVVRLSERLDEVPSWLRERMAGTA